MVSHSIDVVTDAENLTLTVISTYGAPLEHVWRIWTEPRLLERWWGPPGYPATFQTFDFQPGGRANYSMTGPEGDTHGGWWQFTAIEPRRRIELVPGFSDKDGQPVEEPKPTVWVVTFEEDGSSTRTTLVSTFPDLATLEQMVGMGMVEGVKEAASQVPALLEELAAA